MTLWWILDLVLLLGVVPVVVILLRDVLAAQPANAVSLLITAVANTAANRRFTFGIRGRAHAARHQVLGLIAFGITLALTSGSSDVLGGRRTDRVRTAEKVPRIGRRFGWPWPMSGVEVLQQRRQGRRQGAFGLVGRARRLRVEIVVVDLNA